MKLRYAVISLIAWMAFCVQAFAQVPTWDETFEQKKTQTKYLTEQVAALKVYISELQKTYRIAKQGLDFIGNAAKGEFNLHDAFFTSLKQANPEVRNYVLVAEILMLQKQTLTTYKRTMRMLIDDGVFETSGQQYVDEVFQRLLAECGLILDELFNLTTSGRLELEDQQRLSRIDDLHRAMQQCYQFSESFSGDVLRLSRNKKATLQEIENSRINNQLK